jgi:hypothetical protein
METNVSAGLPAAPKSASAPEAVKSGEGVKEVRIDLSQLHEVLGAPRWR